MAGFDCLKTGRFLDKGLQSAARIICPHSANKFHTGSLRGVFRQVRAPAKNDSIFFAAAAANSARLLKGYGLQEENRPEITSLLPVELHVL